MSLDNAKMISFHFANLLEKHGISIPASTVEYPFAAYKHAFLTVAAHPTTDKDHRNSLHRAYLHLGNIYSDPNLAMCRHAIYQMLTPCKKVTLHPS